MRFISSIKFKFTVWYLLVLTVLLIGLSLATYGYLSRNLYESLDDSLIVRTDQLRNIRGVLQAIAQGTFEEEVGEVVVLYYERDGEIYATSRRGLQIQLDTKSVRDAIGGQSAFDTVSVENVGEIRFRIIPFRPDRPVPFPRGLGGPPRGFSIRSAAIAVGQPTDQIDMALGALVRTFLVAIPLTLLVAGAGGVFLAGRALKPVDQMTKVAQEIGETDLNRQIPVNTQDELGRLGSTLNQMLARLSRAFNRQKEFTGDASHELRTPLAVIQAESTLALQRVRTPGEYRGSLETIAEEAESMSRIISQMLALARADSGTDQLVFEELELHGLLREVVDDMQALSLGKNLQWKTRLNGSLTVMGDRGLLKQLFLNLLENSVRYTPQGGEVSITSEVNGHEALLSVSDSGIGISDEHLPHIFERFYRVDKARSRSEGGSGLGLAICQQITELHQGQIGVRSAEGKGTTFTMTIPLVQRPGALDS